MSFKKITEIYKDGRPAYLVFAPNSRIFFLAGKNRVYFHRRFGKVLDSKELSLWLSWGELQDAAELLAYWEKERGTWACFERCTTHFPYHNSAWYQYWAPKARKAVILGDEKVFQLKGKEETIIHPKPVVLKPGICETGELWHRGEAVGSPEGELVGKLFRIGKDTGVKLTLFDACLDRDLTPEEIAAIPANDKWGEKYHEDHNWRYRINIESWESEYFPELLRCEAACRELAAAELTKHEISSAIAG